MTNTIESFKHAAQSYMSRLYRCVTPDILDKVEELAEALNEAWKSKRNVFICGNGGSAANALHIANDFHYGVGACGSGDKMPGLRVEALPSNPGILTCLANDTGYENIYAYQLKTKANANDLLIALSGSGKSKNIINALNEGNRIGMNTFAILGFSGGNCKEIAKVAIHIPINDMQIAEDSQLIIGHICMQWLSQEKTKLSALEREMTK